MNETVDGTVFGRTLCGAAFRCSAAVALGVIGGCAATQPSTPRATCTDAEGLTAARPSVTTSEARTRHLTSAASAPESPEPITTFQGTIGIIDVPRPNQSPATVVDLRSGRHPGFDRFVWQFEGDTVPGYHIEYIDKPVRRCGSGEPTSIAGDAWLEVRLYPSAAHRDDGSPTVDRERTALGLSVALELERTCDFEAVTTWVVGVTRPNAYRVLELDHPTRLVVDIGHHVSR